MTFEVASVLMMGSELLGRKLVKPHAEIGESIGGKPKNPRCVLGVVDRMHIQVNHQEGTFLRLI